MIKFLILFFALLSTSFAKNEEHRFLFNDKVLENMSHYNLVRLHKAYVKFALEIEKVTPYHKDKKYSFLKNIILSKLIYEAYANEKKGLTNGEECFFGGYPSVVDNGKCTRPDQSINNELCLNNSKFLCNPILFGPGICVDTKSHSGYNNVTKRCFEETENSKWYNDERNLNNQTKKGFLDRVQEISQQVGDFCNLEKGDYLNKESHYPLKGYIRYQDKTCESLWLAIRKILTDEALLAAVEASQKSSDQITDSVSPAKDPCTSTEPEESTAVDLNLSEDQKKCVIIVAEGGPFNADQITDPNWQGCTKIEGSDLECTLPEERERERERERVKVSFTIDGTTYNSNEDNPCNPQESQSVTLTTDEDDKVCTAELPKGLNLGDNDTKWTGCDQVENDKLKCNLPEKKDENYKVTFSVKIGGKEYKSEEENDCNFENDNGLYDEIKMKSPSIDDKSFICKIIKKDQDKEEKDDEDKEDEDEDEEKEEIESFDDFPEGTTIKWKASNNNLFVDKEDCEDSSECKVKKDLYVKDYTLTATVKLGGKGDGKKYTCNIPKFEDKEEVPPMPVQKMAPPQAPNLPSNILKQGGRF